MVEEVMEELQEGIKVVAKEAEFDGESIETLEIGEENLFDVVDGLDVEQLASAEGGDQGQDVALLVALDVLAHLADQLCAAQQPEDGNQFLFRGAVELAQASFSRCCWQDVAQVQEELVEQQGVHGVFADLVLCASFLRLPYLLVPFEELCQGHKGFIVNIS